MPTEAVHGRNEFVRGVTTASAIFATAGIGVVVGTGRLDARYQGTFRSDDEPPGDLGR